LTPTYVLIKMLIITQEPSNLTILFGYLHVEKLNSNVSPPLVIRKKKNHNNYKRETPNLIKKISLLKCRVSYFASVACLAIMIVFTRG
jgi:hypothetical protein